MTYLRQSGIVDKGAIIPLKKALCLCLESKREETVEPLRIHETGSSFFYSLVLQFGQNNLRISDLHLVG